MQTRRSLLFAVGAGAPLILGAANKSGSKKPVLGSGAHVFEVTHDWGALPAEISYGNTHGVCEDSRGHIYVHHTGQPLDKINLDMERDKFFKPEEAREYGLIDRVIESHEYQEAPAAGFQIRGGEPSSGGGSNGGDGGAEPSGSSNA